MLATILEFLVVLAVLFIVCRAIYTIVRSFDRQEISQLMGESLSKRAGHFPPKTKG